MKILLDTHILLWFCKGDEKLSLKAREIITNTSNQIYYSVASVWEVEIKHTVHPDKISMSGERLLEHCRRLGFIQAPVEMEHILAIRNLIRKENAPQHRDPFDRLMLCQAIVEDMKFMTHDARIAEYVTDAVCKI